jgi:hypothetical protein
MRIDASVLNQNLLLVETALLQRERIRRIPANLGQSVGGKTQSQIYMEHYRKRYEEFTTCMDKRKEAMEHQASRKVQNLGILAHSGYVLNPETTGIETFQLPENVEIVVFNTPGYPTTSEQLRENWNFNAKYLNGIPIEILKQYFPGMRAHTCKKLQGVGAPITGCGNTCVEGGCEKYYIPAPNPTNASPCDPLNKKYIQAISGSILFEFSQSKIHCHCYGPGDSVPDLLFHAESPSPTSFDIATPIAGIYPTDGSMFASWPEAQFPNLVQSVDMRRSVMLQEKSYPLMDIILSIGTPTTQPIRTFAQMHPEGDYKQLSQILANLQTNTTDPRMSNTNNLSARMQRSASLEERRHRIVIVSCGTCETNHPEQSARLDRAMQALSDFQLTKRVQVRDARHYRTTLSIFGHALTHEILPSLRTPSGTPTGPSLDTEVVDALAKFDQSIADTTTSTAQFRSWFLGPAKGGKRSRKIRRAKRRYSRRR